MSNYHIRRLTPPDARGIPDLTLQVNGPGYFHEEAYNPEMLLRKNQSGELISVVAVSHEGLVVGHCAVERPDHERFGEVGEAMVLPGHREHGLLDGMGRQLLAEAAHEGLAGFYAQAVTHHVRSQKSVAAFGAVPTGLKLGSWVASGFGLSDFPQRVTPMVYFKCFRTMPSRTLYLPEHHRAIAAKIFAGLGQEVTFAESDVRDSDTKIVSSFDQLHRTGTITVADPGKESAAQVIGACDSLTRKSQAEAVFVDILVSRPGAAPVCAELESAGFFFSGIEPHAKLDDYLLRLQMPRASIDFSLIQTASDAGRELLIYVQEERELASNLKS